MTHSHQGNSLGSRAHLLNPKEASPCQAKTSFFVQRRYLLYSFLADSDRSGSWKNPIISYFSAVATINQARMVNPVKTLQNFIASFVLFLTLSAIPWPTDSCSREHLDHYRHDKP